LILEGVATLHELETWYSLDDIADANDALDVWHTARAAAEKAAAEKARR
jgi:hypothetical protein